MEIPRTGETAETAAAWLAADWRLLRAATGAVLPGPLHAGDAEDAAQDAALAIWRHWDDGDDARLGTRTTWAYAIARRRAIDYQRLRLAVPVLPPLSSGAYRRRDARH